MGERQTLHLHAPGGWINDPNGFIYYNGQYHLFYQFNPYDVKWDTMHWGHAVSTDLVHWEHLGVALYPSCEADRDGCFSGSAVEYDGKMYLYYTGVRYTREEIPGQDRPFESAQLLLVSEDGLHFDPSEKTVILPPLDEEQTGDRQDCRDPKIWRGRDAWYMVLGTTCRLEYGKLLFYRSTDLKNWSLQNIYSGTPDLGFMFECPDYFETEGGKVLIFSPMGFIREKLYEPNHSICMSVDFAEPDCTLLPRAPYQLMDYGLELYAPQSTMDAQGRRVLTAWLRMPEPVDGAWIGMFCLPRIVEVTGDHVCFRMHPNVREQFGRKIERGTEEKGDRYLLRMQLQDGEEADIEGYMISRKGNVIHTNRRGLVPEREDVRTSFSTPEIGDEILLEIVVDRNIIEVYINNGMYVITNAVYGLKRKWKLPECCEWYGLSGED